MLASLAIGVHFPSSLLVLRSSVLNGNDLLSRSPDAVVKFRCNFDDGTLCGLVQSTNDDFNWTLNRGPTVSASTGPTADVSGTGNDVLSMQYFNKRNDNVINGISEVVTLCPLVTDFTNQVILVWLVSE